MNGTDIVVIVGGLILGYWIVSRLLARLGRGHSGQTRGRTSNRDSTPEQDADRSTEDSFSKGAEESAGDRAGRGSEDFSGSARGEYRNDRNKGADDSAERPADEWYVVLGVPCDATIPQIKHAYRVQMNQYHPDKVARLGKEIRALAERKSKEINAAYQVAIKIRSAG